MSKLSQDRPILSIITVVLNAPLMMKKTLKSISKLNLEGVEYLVIDGKSHRETLEVIDQYKDYIDVLVSESDTGIYDAMNKGITKATGRGLLFLNAGDCIIGDFNAKEIHVPALLTVKTRNSRNTLTTLPYRHPKMGMPYCHQGVIFENKDILYDTTFKISADYQYFLDFNYHNIDLPKIMDSIYVLFDQNGINTVEYRTRDSENALIINGAFGVMPSIKFRIVAKIKHFIKIILARCR